MGNRHQLLCAAWLNNAKQMTGIGPKYMRDFLSRELIHPVSLRRQRLLRTGKLLHPRD